MLKVTLMLLGRIGFVEKCHPVNSKIRWQQFEVLRLSLSRGLIPSKTLGRASERRCTSGPRGGLLSAQ
jgi:hypothetical protein